MFRPEDTLTIMHIQRKLLENSEKGKAIAHKTETLVKKTVK